MSRLHKIEFRSKVYHIDLSKVSLIELDDESDQYLNVYIYFGDVMPSIELQTRQRIRSDVNEKADELRVIYRDLIFAWDTYDARQAVQVSVTPNDIMSGIQSAAPLGYTGTVSSNTQKS